MRSGAEVITLSRQAPKWEGGAHVPCELDDLSQIDSALDEIGDGWDALIYSVVPGDRRHCHRGRPRPDTGMRHLLSQAPRHLSRGGAIAVVIPLGYLNLPRSSGDCRLLPGTPALATTAPRDSCDDAMSGFLAALSVHAWTSGQIRVNAVSGDSDDEQTTFRWRDAVVRNGVGRSATAEEIASVALFLIASDSAFVNGQNIIADGGFTTGVTSGIYADTDAHPRRPTRAVAAR
jgi:hypothetical protein